MITGAASTVLCIIAIRVIALRVIALPITGIVSRWVAPVRRGGCVDLR